MVVQIGSLTDCGTAQDLKGGDEEYIRWTGELKIRERVLEDLKRLKNIEYVSN